jgi:hypothetical protein
MSKADDLAATISGKIYGKITESLLTELYEMGMIPKAELKVGQTYIGHCRNAREAIWTGTCFNYERTKFGSTFREDINCPEDDDGFDLFVAVGEQGKDF